MPVKVQFSCDACGRHIFGVPDYSRNTSKHGHQVACSTKCRDALLAGDVVAKEDRP